MSQVIPNKFEYMAGNVRNFIHEWREITSDASVLEYVSGIRLEFETVPIQVALPREYRFNAKHSEIIDDEIQSLISKGVVVPTPDARDAYVSNIFLRPKP